MRRARQGLGFISHRDHGEVAIGNIIFPEEQQIAAGNGQASVQWPSDNLGWFQDVVARGVTTVLFCRDGEAAPQMKLATIFMNKAWSRPLAPDDEHGRSCALAASSFAERTDGVWIRDVSIRAMVRLPWRRVEHGKAPVAAKRGARA